MFRFASFLVIFNLAISIFSCQQQAEKEKNISSDSLAYEVITLTKTYQNCKPDTVDCTRILLSFPKFTLEKGDLADSLAFWQNETLGSKETGFTDPQTVMNFFIRRYEAYVTESKGHNLPWNLEKRLSVVQQNRTFISLEMSLFGFEGGAHEFANIQYITLERATGRRLLLKDFFDSTNLKKLTQLGEKYFCEVRDIRPEQSLEEAGFWFEGNQFYLPENFYFSKEGLSFYFNAYEIGPYVMGETQFTIPANKLIMLMRHSQQ